MKNKTLAAILFLALNVFPSISHAGIGCPKGTIPNGEKTPDVSEAWCELESNRAIHHGPYRAWYSNGVLGTEENYDHGKLSGNAIYRWENGKQQAQGQYENGLRNSIWLFWKESGALESRVEYLQGKIISGVVPSWANEDNKHE